MFLLGGCSIDHPMYPITSSYVRAWQYPTCMLVEKESPTTCLFSWLLQCDFGGMLPLGILNAAMPYAMKLFVNSLGQEAEKKFKEKK